MWKKSSIFTGKRSRRFKVVVTLVGSYHRCQIHKKIIQHSFLETNSIWGDAGNQCCGLRRDKSTADWVFYIWYILKKKKKCTEWDNRLTIYILLETRCMILVRVIHIFVSDSDAPTQITGLFFISNFRVFWMLYSFFWLIPGRLNFMCRSFGSLFFQSS
jgi:hypothetical protein